jgi:uncharacterized protein involved in tolerance to divalent cations
MRKQEAIAMFGGSVKDLAAAVEVTDKAIYAWPAELTQAQEDRVIGAAIRTGKLRLRQSHKDASEKGA